MGIKTKKYTTFFPFQPLTERLYAAVIVISILMVTPTKVTNNEFAKERINRASPKTALYAEKSNLGEYKNTVGTTL